MNRVMETMTRVVTNLGVVRVWRTTPALTFFNPAETELRELLGETVWKDVVELGAAIEKFDRVAAYEILDGDGDGVVVYPDWN